jgi:hypothetical protein
MRSPIAVAFAVKLIDKVDEAVLERRLQPRILTPSHVFRR